MIERFLEKLHTSLESGAFVKITLSRPRAREGARNIYGRLVELKGGPAVSFTLRHSHRDMTQNEPLDAADQVIARWLENDFDEAHLFTTTGDWCLRCRPGSEPRLKASRPAFAAAPSKQHDQAKPKAVGNAPFLVKLGVTAADGTARPGMADKLRQVERYVEILGHLVEASPLARAEKISVRDMGAGKGYLTFAVHDFFRRRGAETEVVGVEQRSDLVAICEGVARELDCSGLSFAEGSIGQYALPPQLDVLIALHACDTATDDALAAGVKAGAALLVVAPCCHKEVRRQFTAPPILRDILKHGILEERQAELLTDGLRALVLEACGYETKVFEFISSEHTGKNVMIAATKASAPRPERWLRVREIMAEFGLSRQHLVTALEPR